MNDHYYQSDAPRGANVTITLTVNTSVGLTEADLAFLKRLGPQESSALTGVSGSASMTLAPGAHDVVPLLVEPTAESDADNQEDESQETEDVATDRAPAATSQTTKRRRRTKAEIDAETDAACETALIEAFRTGSDPVLPAAIAKRVGENPKSWITPARYKELKRQYSPAPEPPPEPETDPLGDFAECETRAAEDPAVLAQLRADLGNKLYLLREASVDAARAVVKEYGFSKISQIPDNQVAEILARVENALDESEGVCDGVKLER